MDITGKFQIFNFFFYPILMQFFFKMNILLGYRWTIKNVWHFISKMGPNSKILHIWKVHCIPNFYFSFNFDAFFFSLIGPIVFGGMQKDFLYLLWFQRYIDSPVGYIFLHSRVKFKILTASRRASG